MALDSTILVLTQQRVDFAADRSFGDHRIPWYRPSSCGRTEPGSLEAIRGICEGVLFRNNQLGRRFCSSPRKMKRVLVRKTEGELVRNPEAPASLQMSLASTDYLLVCRELRRFVAAIHNKGTFKHCYEFFSVQSLAVSVISRWAHT